MHKACRKAPAKVMIMNASRKKKKFKLCINKLVLSQNQHLHSGRAFNREMHLYGLHNQRRFVFFILIGFQAFCRFISYVCELVHCCDALHSRDCMRRQKAHPKMTGV